MTILEAGRYDTMAGPAPATRMQRSRGEGRISTHLHNGETKLSTLYQEGCAKIRLPKTHSQTLEAVLINTSGGLTGGDELFWQVDVAPETQMVTTTQACEKIYKSTGAPANVTTRVKVGAHARFDWLPQETILFERSHLHRSLDVDLAEGASLCAVEVILLGREAMGEAARSALLNDNWRITRNGKLIHAEANKLSASDLERDALSLLAGNRAFGTILFVAENAEERIDQIRALIPPNAKAAVSAIGERMIVRLLAPSSLALRRLTVPIIEALSTTGSVPRLWTT